MVAASEEQRRARRGAYITAVFQDPMGSLNPSMRVGAQVAEALGESEPDQIHELLAQTGIPEPPVKALCYPHELSGGLRQRVMIAMALARTPKLVIADEPTTALDVTVQARVLDLLAHAARERGVALLLVTHDLGVAARICDRIAVAYAGRIVEVGTASQILAGHRHPYTVGLLASRPRLNGTIAGGDLPTLPGQPPDPRRPVAGCAFAARCPIADLACAEPPPLVIDGDRTCECHHPGALSGWPSIVEELSAGRALAASAPALQASNGAIPIPALVVEGLECHFTRPRRHPFAAAQDPLRAVAGILQPTAGRVALGPGAPPQLIFQDAGASLTPWMPVGEQIAERLAAMNVPRSERPARVASALEAAGLPAEVAGVLPRKLSGGQRQRAAIARAIVVPPALLACDEPVSALDVSLASQVLNLLCKLRESLGIALLFVTHDLAVARAVADEVAVVKEGLIVELAPTEEIFTAPKHPYTRELIAAVPDLAEAA
jgi:peptide/nickel transport system ATP-binding protein